MCWAITIVLVVNYFKSSTTEAGNILAAWSAVAMSLLLTVTFCITVTARDFQNTLTKLGNERERASKDALEIVEALSSNYNAVYYCDLLTDEIKFLQIGGRIQKYMGAEYAEKHPLEWYANAYCQKLVHEEYREDFLREVSSDNLREKLKDRDYYTYNYVGDKDGHANYFQMKAAKVNNSENHLVVGFADIDDEVRAAGEQKELLEGALTQAKEANSIKDSILENLTTQIIGPVESIVEIARMLSGNESNPVSVISSGNHILMETENLGVILNDIMEMNRINNDQFILKRTKTDLSELLDRVRNDLADRAEEKDIRINYSDQIVHTLVMCDDKRLASILQHVILNAINNSYVGGNINATIVETQVLKKHAYYDIMVEDFGSGMDDQAVESLLSKDASDNVCADLTSTKYLGLSITKAVLDLMDGKLEIINRRREGTTFIIKIALEIIDEA